jgi:RNA polymerase nonessential primary-like sigma factor
MLSDKQRMVIRHRYGIDECELLTLEELAATSRTDARACASDPARGPRQLRRILKRHGISRDALL